MRDASSSETTSNAHQETNSEDKKELAFPKMFAVSLPGIPSRLIQHSVDASLLQGFLEEY
jgi:hypothetical protein